MQELYRQILDVLGRTEEDPVFRKLLGELLSEPIIQRTEVSTSYHFPELGFGLTCFCVQNTRVFRSAVFNIDTQKIRAGEASSFVATMPNQIVCGDTSQDVKEKLRAEPVSSYSVANSKYHEDRYEFPPFTFLFDFDFTTGRIAGLFIRLSSDIESSAEHWTHNFDLN